jgi:nucleotide-binding universal stress UspA family protein
MLIAVDESKGSVNAVEKLLIAFAPPYMEETVLVYVEKIEGKSLIDEMLGDAEMSTLKESLKGTEYQEMLDKQAVTVLNYFERMLKEKGVTDIKRITREGHPADEILAVAKEENVGMIVMGSRGNRLDKLLMMGSVSREVANRAEVPVLIQK